MKIIPNPYTDCFFCGSHNPAGLRLTFQETGTSPNELTCRWRPSSLYVGLGKVLHGGIQSGLFDEIMGWTTFHLTGHQGVTVSLHVDFLKPLFVEQEIEIRCRIESIADSKVNLSGEIKNGEGATCSRASGTYLVMEPDRFKRIVRED